MASDLVDLRGAERVYGSAHGGALRRQLLWSAGAVAIAIMGIALALINPRGYIGGGWDDAHYVDAILAWAEHGPQVGTNHWALRWPLVLSNVVFVHLFGFERSTLMIPAIMVYVAAGLALYAVVSRLAGRRAGFVAALTLLTIPELARWSAIIYPDAMEVLLWCLSLGCFWFGSDEQNDTKHGWLLVSGLAAGVAWGLRETALGLWAVYAIAFLLSYRMPRARYGWIALTAFPVLLIEYAIYWQATGDPLYRFHVDMQHVAVPSSDMTGATAAGISPLLNPTIMSKWIGAGPVHLHWLIDPYLNLLADHMGGLVFAMLLLIGGIFWRRRSTQTPAYARALDELCRALLIVMAANILVNLYVLAVRPGPRMFLPALMAGSALIGIAFARLDVAWFKRTVAGFLVIKALLTAIITDVAPDFTQVARMSNQLIESVSAPVHVNAVTDLHMRFAAKPFRERLTLSETPVGGYYLAIGLPYDNAGVSGQDFSDHSSEWTLVSLADTGQIPWTVRLLSAPVHTLGLMQDFRYQSVQARLYMRTPQYVASDVTP